MHYLTYALHISYEVCTEETVEAERRLTQSYKAGK